MAEPRRAVARHRDAVVDSRRLSSRARPAAAGVVPPPGRRRPSAAVGPPSAVLVVLPQGTAAVTTSTSFVVVVHRVVAWLSTSAHLALSNSARKPSTCFRDFFRISVNAIFTLFQQTCQKIEISLPCGIRQGGVLSPYLFALYIVNQYCQPLPHYRPVSSHSQGILYFTTAKETDIG